MRSYSFPDMKTAEESVRFLNECQVWRNESTGDGQKQCDRTETDVKSDMQWTSTAQTDSQQDHCLSSDICDCRDQSKLPQLPLIQQLDFDYFVPESDQTLSSDQDIAEISNRSVVLCSDSKQVVGNCNTTVVENNNFIEDNCKMNLTSSDKMF